MFRSTTRSSFVIFRVTTDHRLDTSLTDAPFVAFSNCLLFRKSVMVPGFMGPYTGCGGAWAGGGVGFVRVRVSVG